MLRHGPIEQVADNLWRVVAPVPRMLLERQMVVAADAAGRLLIHNGIALNQSEQRRLEALGEPTWLVVPNGYHRLDAAAYKRRYPQLVVIAPEGARRRVSAVVHVDQSYSGFGRAEAFALEHAAGTNEREGVVLVRSRDGVTLVFNDLLFNPPKHGFVGLIHRALKQGPHVPWLAKRMFVADSAQLRRWLLSLATTPGLCRLIPAHIEPVWSDAARTLISVANQL